MKINLSRERAIYTETGTKVLTESQLLALADGNTTSSAFTIASGETLSIVCDLSARYNLYQVVYYRTRATSDTITVYGRQVSSESWTTLTSVNTTTTTTVDVAGEYKYIRIVHLVSSGSATSREVEVYAQDEPVGLSAEKYSVDSGTNELTAQAISVVNTDDLPHDYFFLLDGSDTDSEGYGLSYTSSGTFYSLYSTGVSFPTNYAWSSGSFTNTGVVSNTVRITSGTSGFYYTPVIDLNSVDGRRIFWKATASGSNSLDVDGRVDSLPTIEVRMSNTVPTGSWVSGQLSTDSRWSVVSGTLPFEIMTNNTILDPAYRRYFQARVEFHSAGAGQTPILEKLGVEAGLKITLTSGQEGSIYIKSSNSSNNKGQDTAVLVFFFEARNT